MANQYTQHYDLCQWAPEDAFNRTEFNGDNAKVDAALHGLETGKADRTEVDAVVQQISEKTRMISGSYMGSGSAKILVSIWTTPKVVLVEQVDGRRGYGRSDAVLGGLAVDGTPLGKSGQPMVEVAKGGFYVYNRDGAGSLNSSGVEYNFLAFL